MRRFGWLSVVFGLVGCDSDAVLYPKRTVFLEARVIGAWPARPDAGGVWQPVCSAADGPPTGLITSVALIGSLTNAAPGAIVDEDISIRPGDIVEQRVVGGRSPEAIRLEGGMSLELNCIDPLVVDQPTDDPAACAGTVPAAAVDAVGYHAVTADRDEAHEVLILIDQSGSIGGLVDADTRLEPPANGSFDIPDNLAPYASDGGGRRIAAAQELIRSLNPRDKVGVVLFGEDSGSTGLIVPCGAAEGLGVEDGLRACFGVNHDQWVGPQSRMNVLGQRTLGRSNLWRALRWAHGFMVDPARSSARSRHIVVLTDGPDTCAGEHLEADTAACSSDLASDFQDDLGAARADPDAARVQVHFVQFESTGYPGRDPAQVQAACMARGHYRFIDTNALHGQATDLARAFTASVLDVRLALMGHWEIAAEVPAFASDAPAPQGSAPGLHALGGRVVIEPASRMVSTPESFGFAGNAVHDRRPTVLKP